MTTDTCRTVLTVDAIVARLVAAGERNYWMDQCRADWKALPASTRRLFDGAEDLWGAVSYMLHRAAA